MKSVLPIRAGAILSALLLCLLGLAQGTFALDSIKPLSQYKRVTWNTEKGLPQTLVLTMAQARDGYLWIGTHDGLARFNGVSFEVFDKATSPALKSSLVSALFEDRAGNLWIGTDNGLYRWQDGEFLPYLNGDGSLEHSVNVIYEDREGIIWVGTAGGLLCLREEKVISYTTKEGLSSNRVSDIGEDADGNLWVGTKDGLNLFRDNRFKIFTVNEGLADNSVRAIQRDTDNNLWIGGDSGVSLWQNGRFVSDARFTGKKIYNIEQKKAGYLWFCGDFGISRVKGNKIETLERGKGILNSGVITVLEDTEGSLWVATEDDSLIQFIDTKFVTFTNDNGLAGGTVHSIDQNSRGDIWVGGEKGAIRFHQNAFDVNLTVEQGLPNARVTAVLDDEADGLLVGTTKGLFFFKENESSKFILPAKILDVQINSLYRDSDNKLWVGTKKGIYGLHQSKDGITLNNLEPLKSLSETWITTIVGNSSKGLWIGTLNGLFLFRNDKLTQIKIEKKLPSDAVLSLYEEPSGALWIGTFAGGITRYKNGNFTSYSTENGLFNANVYKILPGDDGNLWMSSSRGIFRVAKNVLDEFMDGTREAVDSVVYGTADGMESFECTGNFRSSGLKALDGKLWFPTMKGVTVIDTKNMPLNQKPPPVRLESFVADTQTIPISGKPILTAETNRLEFRFAALSFVAPEKNKFRYRLEGYDADWIDGGSKREVVYTNLPHSEYTFRVIASNNDGVWNETGDSITFSIKPFFYQTWWFRLLFVIAAFVIIAAIHFWRVRILRARHEAVLNERQRIARELHDTLLQGFVGVSSQLSVVAAQLLETPEIAERHLKIARNMIRHSVTEARRSVQNLRTSETDEAFTEILKKTVKRITQGSDLKTEIKINGTPFEMSAEITHHLLLIVEEATVNTIKHAAADNLQIVCTFNAQSIRLEIIDDGKGFAEKNVLSTLNGHFGVVGMMERAEKIGGELRIEENPTGGTKIVFESKNCRK